MTFKAEFCAGLGDIIIRAYQEGRLQTLATLPEGDEANVVFWSSNPFSHELLEWCPARSRLRIRQYPFERRDHHIWRKTAGLDSEDKTGEVPVSPKPPVWYPPVSEMQIITPLTKRPFILVAAGAGSGVRSIPKVLLDRIVSQLDGHDVIYVGRSYRNTFNRTETQPEKLPYVFNLIDKLSVPGVLRLVGMAQGIIASHSAIYHAGIYLKKPTLLLYPPSTVHYHIKENTGYCYGMDFPTTVHTEFSKMGPAELERFKALL